MFRLATRFAVLLALAGMLASCDQNQVGSENMFKNKSGGAAAIGDASPSPSAAAQHSAPATQTSQPTKAPPTLPPTQKPQAAHFPIGIYADTASGHPQFDPSAARVYKGTIITFTNHDSVPRSVQEADHTPALFDSGSIAPGGTWPYTAATAGTFNYHDGTRPYAVAYFQVQ